uniref:Uncharacterized protein n=1 Tax=uncultured marine group II/III euryarchaeote AD1000_51_G10 TaxID=1457781 RepID=A0A075FZ17_9EURY|nr:hypothetical protein [uncultured marine group II/III euryarchaeote AD1000_51_G10]
MLLYHDIIHMTSRTSITKNTYHGHFFQSERPMRHHFRLNPGLRRAMPNRGPQRPSILYKSLGSTEEPYDSDMTHSYRLTEGRLIRYPMIQAAASILATSLEVTRASIPLSDSLQLGRLASVAASTSSPLRNSLK